MASSEDQRKVVVIVGSKEDRFQKLLAELREDRRIRYPDGHYRAQPLTDEELDSGKTW